jgi:hypothetical protein
VGAAAARQLALQAAGDVARGVDVLVRKREARADGERARHNTWTTFITQRYEPWALTYLKSGEFQVERIEADFADWMAKPLVDINSWLIEGWRKRQLAAGLAPSTINRNLQRLRGLLSKAVQWKVIDQHPFADIKPLKFDRTGEGPLPERHRGETAARGAIRPGAEAAPMPGELQ